MDDDNVCRCKLEETHGLADGFTRQVHVGEGLHQQNLLTADFAFGNLRLEFPRPGREGRQALQRIHGHEADVVTVSRILGAGVTKACDDLHGACPRFCLTMLLSPPRNVPAVNLFMDFLDVASGRSRADEFVAVEYALLRSIGDQPVQPRLQFCNDLVWNAFVAGKTQSVAAPALSLP